MDLQKQVLIDFKRRYPHYTLRSIAHLTSINMTRLHRIFSGHEMKIREYEKFYEILYTNPSPEISMKNLPLPIQQKIHCFIKRQQRIQKHLQFQLNAFDKALS